MSDAAQAAFDWVSGAFVEQEFPNPGQWTFRLPAEHSRAANELVALRLVRTATSGGYLRLTDGGVRTIMRNRPDLDDDTWSNEADDFRDTASMRYEAANFPPFRAFPLGELSKRLRGELRALGFIEQLTAGRWVLTLAGQQWLINNLAA